MIHEVRELKRQLDPNAKDIHIWHKRYQKHSHSQSPSPEVDDSDSVFYEDSDGEQEQRKVRESSTEVVRKSDDGEYYEKKYSKTETFTTKKDSGDSPSRKRRALPALPAGKSRESSQSLGMTTPVEVEILNQVYPPADSLATGRDTSDHGLLRTGPVKATTFFPIRNSSPVLKGKQSNQEESCRLALALQK